MKYLVFNHGEYDDKTGGFEDLAGIFNSFEQAERFVISLEGGYSMQFANIWAYDCESEPVRKQVYEHRYRAKQPYWVRMRISEDGQRIEHFQLVDGAWIPEVKHG